MSFADRGRPDVVIPEGALMYDPSTAWCVNQAAIEVMGRSLTNAFINGPDRYERAVRLLFVDAKLSNRYDELVKSFVTRLLKRHE